MVAARSFCAVDANFLAFGSHQFCVLPLTLQAYFGGGNIPSTFVRALHCFRRMSVFCIINFIALRAQVLSAGVIPFSGSLGFCEFSAVALNLLSVFRVSFVNWLAPTTPVLF